MTGKNCHYKTIDCNEEESLATILPNPPILSSHSTEWSDLKLACYQQPASQTENLSFLHHVISINTGGRIRKKRKLEGVSETACFEHGNISITPAIALRQVHLMDSSEFVHLYIPPLALNYFAYESLQSQVEIQPQFNIQDPIIYQIGLRLKRELEISSTDSPFYIESAAVFLLAHLIKHYSTEKLLSRKHPNALNPSTLQIIKDFIEQNLDQDLSLNNLANQVQMSSFSLARAYKSSTGNTLHQEIILARIAKAKNLLHNPQLSITEISLQVGFKSHSHFSNVFRRITGATPSRFRQHIIG